MNRTVHLSKPAKIIITALSIMIVCAAVVVLSKYANFRTGDVFDKLNEAVSTTAYNAGTSLPAATAQQQLTQALVSQPLSTEPLTQAPAAPAQPAVSEPSSSAALVNKNPTQAEVIAAMCSAVNGVKNAKNFAAVKDQDVKIQLTECSISVLVTPINALIEKFAGTEQLNYSFVNGSCIGPKSGEPVTPKYVIPPSDKDFTLDLAGLTSVAFAEQNGNMVYQVKIKEEACTLANQEPYYHSMAMDYIDVNEIDLGVAKVTQADILYKESTITVTTDATGRILVYEEYMPVDAAGGGSMGVSASGKLTGYLWERWTFTW